MKKVLFSVFALLITITANIYSQSGWFWQNPKPQGNTIFEIKMFDSESGIFINSDNILRTADGGQSWQLTYTGFPWENKSISMPDGNNYFMLVDTCTIIKTTNKGVTWQYVSNTPDIKNSFIYFKDINTGFAVNDPGEINSSMAIYRTTNGGLNWQYITSNNSINITSVKFINSQTGFASGRMYISGNIKTKIFKTINGGSSWDTVANNFAMQNPQMYFASENTGFLYGYESGGNGLMYRSTNAGINWSLINHFWVGSISKIHFVDPLNGFALSGSRISKTSNGGINWISQPQILINTYLREIFFSGINTGYAAGNSGVILKTTNSGINWTSLTGENLLNNNLWDVSFSDNNTGFTVSDFGKILRTTNGGNSWQLFQFAANLNFTAIAKVNSNVWYIATWDQAKILKTTNTGLSWDTTYANTYGPTRLEFVNELTGYGVCKYNSFIKTTNGGVNWTVTAPFGSQNWALDFVDENTGFVCGSGGKLDKTTDGGVTWARYSPLPYEYYAADIKFVNHNTGYIALGNGVIKTTNGGINWQQSLLSTNQINDLNFVNDRMGFALGHGEAYKTTNSGNNWYKVRTCTTNPMLSVHFSDSLTGLIVGDNGTIIKTTNGGGTPIGVSQQSNEIPNNFNLSQNYPNPFNPTTIIEYSLPKSSFVKIKVYDLLGRFVKLLVNEQKSNGSYSISFDGAGLASGVYFYTIETPDFIQSKKMVLLK